MRRRGFTLLELIVATTLFGIVIAAAYTLFDSSRRLAARAEARAELFQAGRAAIAAIEADLRGAVMSGTAFDTGLIGTSGGSANAPQDKIELVAVNGHTANLKETERRSDVSKVTYWIQTDASSTKQGLVRERQALLTPVTVYARRDENVEEVAPQVVQLRLRYWDQEWKDSWDSTSLRKLPKAIEATVVVRGEWRGEEELETFTTGFYLPVGAETPEKQP
jgi:general secretion pathway protein J